MSEFQGMHAEPVEFLVADDFLSERDRDEAHRESRHDEFFGWCLGALRERRRLFPPALCASLEGASSEPANGLIGTASALMQCGLNEALQEINECCIMWEFVTEWGWPTTISLIGSAMAELERETV